MNFEARNAGFPDLTFIPQKKLPARPSSTLNLLSIDVKFTAQYVRNYERNDPQIFPLRTNGPLASLADIFLPTEARPLDSVNAAPIRSW